MAIKLPKGLSKKDLTVDFFNQYLWYSHSTGWLHWKGRGIEDFTTPHQMNVWHTRFAFKRAGSIKGHPIGYGKVQITLAKQTFSAHRIIALMFGMIDFYGDPEIVDHIDGNPANNKRENLRMVSHEINLRNQKRGSKVKGVAGVNYNKLSKKWQASIGRGKGKSKMIGYYEDWFEAVCARKSEERSLGYSDRHCKWL